MLVKVRNVLGQVIDGEQLRQLPEARHGLLAGQVGIPRELGVKGTAVLQNQGRRAMEIAHGQHACGGIIEVHAPHLQRGKEVLHILQGIRRFQPQLVENIRPHVQHPEIHGLRQCIDAVTYGGGHQQAFLKAVCHLHKIT